MQIGALNHNGILGVHHFAAINPGIGVGLHGRAQAQQPIRRHLGVVVKVGEPVALPNFGQSGQPVARRGRAHIDGQVHDTHPLRPGFFQPALEHGPGIVRAAVVQDNDRGPAQLGGKHRFKGQVYVRGLVPGIEQRRAAPLRSNFGLGQPPHNVVKA